MNERDSSKSLNLKELRSNEYCNYLKYMKSNYFIKTYPELLLSSESNLKYHKKLINQTNNIYTKYYYTKILIQHGELINKIKIKMDELLGYLCKNNEEIEVANLKNDLLMLHIFEYQSYYNALNILSEIKIFYKNLHRFDIEDQIDVLNYKTNLAGIEYVKLKLKNNNMINESNRVNEIINNYKISHNDDLLDEVKNIEGFQNINKKLIQNNILIILFIILIILYFYLSNRKIF